MKKVRLASTLALTLAGLAGGVPAPTPAAQQTVSASQRGTEKSPAAVAPAASALRIAAMLDDYTPLIAERRSAVWQGTAKRGNRRNRSRWNFNR